jgi:glycosyltransferase involved in cell wall biosynthesis
VVALVPAYNAAGFIGQTVAALAAQTYRNLRVVVSVDRSDDDTAAQCAACARNDSRFTVLRQPQRLGWIGNCNVLLAHADGDLCFFAAHDDRISADYVSRLTAALLANPRAVVAFSDLERVWQDGRSETLCYTDLENVTSPVERCRRLLLRRDGWWIPFRGLTHLRAARSTGGLRRHMAGEFVADWPYIISLALRGEFVRVPEPLYTKCERPTSLSNGWAYGGVRWAGVYLACARALATADLTLSERSSLLATFAHRAAAGGTGWLRRQIREFPARARMP